MNLGLQLALGGLRKRGGRGDVTSSGGIIRDGESFSLYYALGGLTGKTSVTINGINCTDVVIVDDKNLTAKAPDDDLLHGVTYSVEIA